MAASSPHARLADQLMDRLGRELLGEPLQARGWTFGFDRARRRLGACRPRQRRITLSAPLAKVLSAADIEDTLRHEIAHAIDVERRGRTNHDATWQALAVACGASPERLFDGDVPDNPDAPYASTCPSCGASGDLYRQPVHPRRCKACRKAGLPSYHHVVHRASGRVIWPGGETPGPYGGTAGVQATYPGCGTVTRRARRPTRAQACGPCCAQHAGGRFDPRFTLRWSRPS